MPWRGHNAQDCRVCDRHVSECGPLSARYKCQDCGERAMLENRRELVAFRGPRYERWRAACAATFSVLPVDTGPPKA